MLGVLVVVVVVMAVPLVPLDVAARGVMVMMLMRDSRILAEHQ